jgi:hypothetical protein
MGAYTTVKFELKPLVFQKRGKGLKKIGEGAFVQHSVASLGCNPIKPLSSCYIITS